MGNIIKTILIGLILFGVCTVVIAFDNYMKEKISSLDGSQSFLASLGIITIMLPILYGIGRLSGFMNSK